MRGGVPVRDRSALEDVEGEIARAAVDIRCGKEELTDRAVVRMHLDGAIERLRLDMRDKRILLEEARLGDLRRTHHRKVKGGDEEPDEAEHPRG